MCKNDKNTNTLLCTCTVKYVEPVLGIQPVK